MKKSMILAGMLSVGFAYAQEGRVGINTEKPKATLDIQPNEDNAKVDATTNQGIIIPKLSKARVMSIATSNLVEGTKVYVTDEVTTADTQFIGIGKGFYFYNGTKWVKQLASDTDNNSELWAQRDNAGVTETYLKPADEKTDFLGFTSDRKFKLNLGNIEENDFNYQSSNNNMTKGLAMSEVPFLTTISSDVLPDNSTVGANNKFFFSHNNSLLKEKHASKNPTGRYYGKEDRLLIKDVNSEINQAYGFSGVVDLHSNNQLKSMIGIQGFSIAGTDNGNYSNATVTTITGGRLWAANYANATNIEGIKVAVDNYKKADNLRGGLFSTISQSLHNGQVAPHTIKNLFGIENNVRLAPNGTVRKFMGIYNKSYISANTTFEKNDSEVRGILSSTEIEANANVDITYGNIIALSTLQNNSYVKDLIDFGTYPVIKSGARINKYTAVNISLGEIDKTAKITEMVGLRIGNMDKGTKGSYAIHTNAGEVSFGDNVNIRNTRDISLGEPKPPFMIGSNKALNIGMDENEIMARNNGAAAPLYLQSEGGDLFINSSNEDVTKKFHFRSSTGSVGIGVITPNEKLEVNGAIKVANTSSTCTAQNAGTIKFEGDNFYGCKSEGWVKLNN